MDPLLDPPRSLGLSLPATASVFEEMQWVVEGFEAEVLAESSQAGPGMMIFLGP